MRVSIVMTYFERQQQLHNTLVSILNYNHENLEIVIIDDCSVKEQISQNTVEKFINNEYKKKRLINKPIVKVNRINKKSYNNPCIAYNVGLKLATGELIIIQNSECLHVHNIVKHAKSNLNVGNYFSYSCYSIDQSNLKALNNSDNLIEKSKEFLSQSQTLMSDGQNGWYNHSKYRPVYYHFTSAIMREDLKKIGGFDPRYRWGIGYDDNEFLIRIQRAKLNIKIIDDFSVIHQWHYAFPKKPNYIALKNLNESLFQNVTLKEEVIKPTYFSIYFLKFVLKNYLYKLFKRNNLSQINLSEQINQNSSKDYTHFYFDLGNGYSESLKLSLPLLLEGNSFSVTLQIPSQLRKIKAFRWDPIEGKKIHLQIQDVKNNGLPLKILGYSSHYIDPNGYICFKDLDPQVFFNPPQKSSKITIKGQIKFIES